MNKVVADTQEGGWLDKEECMARGNKAKDKDGWYAVTLNQGEEDAYFHAGFLVAKDPTRHTPGSQDNPYVVISDETEKSDYNKKIGEYVKDRDAVYRVTGRTVTVPFMGLFPYVVAADSRKGYLFYGYFVSFDPDASRPNEGDSFKIGDKEFRYMEREADVGHMWAIFHDSAGGGRQWLYKQAGNSKISGTPVGPGTKMNPWMILSMNQLMTDYYMDCTVQLPDGKKYDVTTSEQGATPKKAFGEDGIRGEIVAGTFGTPVFRQL